MIITFTNQKGGTGKTTNCIMFANYLSEIGISVQILDVDFQQSAKRKRDRDVATYDNIPPYDILPCGSLDEGLQFIKSYDKENSINLLVDLPGHLDDIRIMKIISLSDVVITPFTYEEMVLQSTFETVNFMEKCGVEAQVFMVPNMMNKSVRYDRKIVEPELNKYGVVTKDVPERVALQRITTLGLQDKEKELVEPAYSQIVEIAQIK
ncbi:MAG: ParA family protein [Prevotellaceae bacterium]|nr:ParA family protein [Prevotellaceae bacterium]